MILSTTPQIEGHTIREYKGIVTSETIIGANMFKDLFAGIPFGKMHFRLAKLALSPFGKEVG